MSEHEKQIIVTQAMKVLLKAATLASIADDWNLGTNGKIEINDEWVELSSLRNEFNEACNQLNELRS